MKLIVFKFLLLNQVHLVLFQQTIRFSFIVITSVIKEYVTSKLHLARLIIR